MSWIEVTPAYGRDYTTADKDFRETATGSYIIRYADSRKVTSA